MSTTPFFVQVEELLGNILREKEKVEKSKKKILHEKQLTGSDALPFLTPWAYSMVYEDQECFY